MLAEPQPRNFLLLFSQQQSLCSALQSLLLFLLPGPSSPQLKEKGCDMQFVSAVLTLRSLQNTCVVVYLNPKLRDVDAY